MSLEVMFEKVNSEVIRAIVFEADYRTGAKSVFDIAEKNYCKNAGKHLIRPYVHHKITSIFGVGLDNEKIIGKTKNYENVANKIVDALFEEQNV